MDKFTKNIVVQSTETDKNKKYKYYAALCATQEIAQNHASLLGFGYDELDEKNCFWVLSRIKLKFNQYPLWRDNIKINTWHKGAYGIFALRDFEFYKGDVLAIQGTSSWLILDATTHRMLRPESVITSQSELSSFPHAIEEPCDKLTSPKEMEFSYTKTVSYSDIDMLGHTNNAKYLEWAFNGIDPEILYSRDIKECQINFVAETHIGEKIDIYQKQISEDTIFVEGHRDNKVVFQLIMTT